MSRIGKLPVQIPAGVTITVDESGAIVNGPKGNLKQFIMPSVTVSIDGDQAVVSRKDDSKVAKSQHGLMRSLLSNMVVGVTKGFEKKLEINGVGFRVSGGGQSIDMSLGFSHPVKYQARDGVTLAVEKMTITVSGIDKQQVGQVAAEIRELKNPSRTRARGIKYAGEHIIRKAGKAGK